MRILVTGGSGSFGTAFISRMAKDPDVERIVCYSRGEYAQQKLAMSLGLNIRGDNSNVRFFLGDVRDYRRLRMAMRGITHVVHAAALKIVPTGEYNPTEFTKTNVGGADNVIDAAIDAGVERVVGLSSDKSCAPINLYGASKLCAEKTFVAANAYGGMSTRFSVVRYGNVTGSTGSVVPIWWEKALKREPLPITTWGMSRFFMDLDEAVDLVLWTLENARGGEVFIPELPGYMIGNLAAAVWFEATHDTPSHGWPHTLIGVREGEKSHESMISEDESYWCWKHESNGKFMILASGDAEPGWEKVDPGFRYRSDHARRMDLEELRTRLVSLGWFTPPPVDQTRLVERAKG